ncbi:DUF418 domain-containing protein [Rhizosaccharibacter radicis]|uniref:DUF418 domain-containing protein n=1 Tax=Rhizosaccharibacter radicis TaxID=2782605 RepID=A0ABT1VXG2_9PROT|nr:DUF418 domain-containing protein [Acetobacteraceae bacterium KSS12]
MARPLLPLLVGLPLAMRHAPTEAEAGEDVLSEILIVSSSTAPATVTSPVSGSERLQVIDVIRGFALFGVIWMNLFVTTRAFMPRAVQAALPTAPLDRIVGFLGEWLVEGKAQCLFGVLFGVGFALFTDRVLRRGGDAGRIYRRRLGFLLLLGLLQLFFLWFGDILHDYAALGFLLPLVRRWSGRALLATGLLLLLGSEFLADQLAGPLVWLDPGLPAPVSVQTSHGAFWNALSDGDYRSMVTTGFQRVLRNYGRVDSVISTWGPIAGQFLIGAWIYRQGWLQKPAAHEAATRRAVSLLLPSGLALSLAAILARQAAHGAVAETLAGLLNTIATPWLAAGYGALLAILCGARPNGWAVRGIAAFGRMALTNYVSQSLFYLLVFDGFGLGLVRRSGATADLAMACGLFAVQVAVSLWWLRHFRFGALEWVWRSATYGRWQPFRA